MPRSTSSGVAPGPETSAAPSPPGVSPPPSPPRSPAGSRRPPRVFPAAPSSKLPGPGDFFLPKFGNDPAASWQYKRLAGAEDHSGGEGVLAGNRGDAVIRHVQTLFEGGSVAGL